MNSMYTSASWICICLFCISIAQVAAVLYISPWSSFARLFLAVDADAGRKVHLVFCQEQDLAVQGTAWAQHTKQLCLQTDPAASSNPKKK